MKKLFFIAIVIIGAFFITDVAYAQTKAKFYNFEDQVVDGEIRKPTALYTDARQQVRFDRLLKLKKSFLPSLFKTSKDRVFK